MVSKLKTTLFQQVTEESKYKLANESYCDDKYFIVMKIDKMEFH